jgi:DNA-binding NtrC family response regulator
VVRALRAGAAPAKPTLMLATLGRAPIMVELKQRLERVAGLKVPVLFWGEPGSGVELCARFLHQPNSPWVAPESGAMLAEAPLDLLQQAREGTLFVHEVGELTRIEQKGLLLLAGRLDKFNTRLICATSRSLPELVAEGSFDSRLYSAMAGMAIHVPSLREHREDVPDLANLFLLRCIEAKEAPPRHFSTGALNTLRNHDWPGNLAQLESVVRTLAVTALDEEISLNDVSQALGRQAAASVAAVGLPLDLPLREARDAFERVYFEHHIAKEDGNMSRVADSVGLERTHLYRKLKQLGIRIARRGDE